MIIREGTYPAESRANMRGGKGAAELTPMVGQLSPNVRLFSKIRLAPGCSIGEHVHEGETELFYFLTGSGIAFDDGVEMPIAAGDVMVTENGHRHAIENTGDVDLNLLAVIILNPA